MDPGGLRPAPQSAAAAAAAAAAGAGAGASAADEPRDARVVRELLRSMGLSEGEYEPRVVHQFLDLAYRYVGDVLGDAQVYADHAGKPQLDADDVRLAIQSKVNFSFSQPPPRECSEFFHSDQDFRSRSLPSDNPLFFSMVLLEVARNRNKIPLPKSIAPPGSIPLPPEQDTLLSQNYQLLAPLKPPPQFEETEDDNEGANPTPTSNPSNPSPNNLQEQQQLPQHGQRVSFQLNAVAAAKRRGTMDQLNMG
uniref:Transcription initiation factor TFIID subunit 9 n=1 Tax=Oryza glaberrima TaxID=4538 RepID=I1PC66_ORYGL